MGQKGNPIGLRLCTGRTHDSLWYADNASYSLKLYEDYCIRKYIFDAFSYAAVSRILIKRSDLVISVVLHSFKPGLIIGKKGVDIDKLRARIASISKVRKDDVNVDVFELKNADGSAVLVAKNIANQLERRASFRRVIKLSIQNALRVGVKGIKVSCSGRLNGADIARVESFKSGSVPLHKLRADIDYWVAEAHTTYGIVGIKVWIYKGDFVKISLEERGLKNVYTSKV